MSKIEPLAIPAACRSELHTSMARMLEAGMSADRALSNTQALCDGKFRGPVARAVAAVAKGVTLTRAMNLTGLLLPSDRALLEAGEAAGRIDAVFAELGVRYDGVHARLRAVRARLAMPAVVFALALFLMPLPALIGGRIGVMDFLLRSVGVLITIAIGLKLLMATWQRYERTGWPRSLTRLLDRVPLWGSIQRDRGRTDALSNLQLMLASGIPARDAVTRTARAETNPQRADELDRASRALERGTNVTQALREGGLLDSQSVAVIDSAEAAGQLEQGLLRRVTQGSREVDNRLDLLAEWTPRAVYAGVVVVMAWSLLSSGITPSAGFAPADFMAYRFAATP